MLSNTECSRIDHRGHREHREENEVLQQVEIGRQQKRFLYKLRLPCLFSVVN